MTSVFWKKSALRDLKKAPKHIQNKAQAWAESVEMVGAAEVRKIPGWHDEPLQGKKKGRRSIRLNIQWRLEYVEKNGQTILVEVEKVHSHKY